MAFQLQLHDLYWTVDSTGATLDFMLSATRDADAAERFFRQVLQAPHTLTPRVITVDKNAAYSRAFDTFQHDGTLPETCLLSPCKYVNHVAEQDYRMVKRQVNPGLEGGAFHTAQRTIQGYEAMHMLRKGQYDRLAKGDVLAQNRVINQLCGFAAERRLAQPLLELQAVFATRPRSVPPVGPVCSHDQGHSPAKILYIPLPQPRSAPGPCQAYPARAGGHAGRPAAGCTPPHRCVPVASETRSASH
jgi:hypothetical protein